MTASPVLAAFGNPLLDIIVREGCEGLVERHGLARNIAQEVDTLQTGLYGEVTARWVGASVPETSQTFPKSMDAT